LVFFLGFLNSDNAYSVSCWNTSGKTLLKCEKGTCEVKLMLSAYPFYFSQGGNFSCPSFLHEVSFENKTGLLSEQLAKQKINLEDGFYEFKGEGRPLQIALQGIKLGGKDEEIKWAFPRIGPLKDESKILEDTKKSYKKEAFLLSLKTLSIFFGSIFLIFLSLYLLIFINLSKKSVALNIVKNIFSVGLGVISGLVLISFIGI